MSLQRTMKRAPKRDVDVDSLAAKVFHKGKRGRREYRVAIAGSVLKARKPKFTPKKFQKHVTQLSAKARFVSGLLIRASGQAAVLVKEVFGLDAYHQKIYDRGTTISPAMLKP